MLRFLLIFKDYSPVVGTGEELLFDLGVPAAAVQHGRVALWGKTRQIGSLSAVSMNQAKTNEGYIIRRRVAKQRPFLESSENVEKETTNQFNQTIIT